MKPAPHERITRMQEGVVEAEQIKRLAQHPEIVRWLAREEAAAVDEIIALADAPARQACEIAYLRAIRRLAGHLSIIIKTAPRAELRLRQMLEMNPHD